MSEPTAVHRPKSENPRALLTLAALLTLGIFLIDVLTPLTIAVAVLYVVVVLLVAATGSQQATLYSAIGCAALTIFAFLFQRTVTEDAGPLARCVFSLLALATHLAWPCATSPRPPSSTRKCRSAPRPRLRSHAVKPSWPKRSN